MLKMLIKFFQYLLSSSSTLTRLTSNSLGNWMTAIVIQRRVLDRSYPSAGSNAAFLLARVGRLRLHVSSSSKFKDWIVCVCITE